MGTHPASKPRCFFGTVRQDFLYAKIGQGKFQSHEAAYTRLLADLDGATMQAVGHRITHAEKRYFSREE